MANFKLCTLPISQIAANGSPIGLIKNAITSKTAPFCGAFSLFSCKRKASAISQTPNFLIWTADRNAPVILVLTLFVWLCMGLIYISGLVLGLLSTVIALLGVAVLITYSPQNGAILLIMAFLISPMGLPLAAIWLLGKVQSLKFAIQDWVYG